MAGVSRKNYAVINDVPVGHGLTDTTLVLVTLTDYKAIDTIRQRKRVLAADHLIHILNLRYV